MRPHSLCTSHTEPGTSAWEPAVVERCRPALMSAGGAFCLWQRRGGLRFNKDYYNTRPQIRAAPGTEPLYCFTAHSEGLTSIKRSDKCVIITSQLIRWETSTLRAQCTSPRDSRRWRGSTKAAGTITSLGYFNVLHRKRGNLEWEFLFLSLSGYHSNRRYQRPWNLIVPEL